MTDFLPKSSPHIPGRVIGGSIASGPRPGEAVSHGIREISCRWQTVPTWGGIGDGPAKMIRMELEDEGITDARLVPPDSIESLGIVGDDTVFKLPPGPSLTFSREDVDPDATPRAR